MMNTIRRSEERGRANHGWLQSFHSFSFANYYDPKHMGVSHLRVINEDRVTAGSGFGTHPHQNMEIISYVLSGSLEHKDSMGNIQRMQPGEFQLMSAGTGITHSEYNPLNDKELHFLQIWVEPDRQGLKPSYQQKLFDDVNGLQLIASPNGDSDSLSVHQDARLYRLRLDAGQDFELAQQANRSYYLHLIEGQLEGNGMTIGPGDALILEAIGDDNSRNSGVEALDRIKFQAAGPIHALLFDLAADGF